MIQKTTLLALLIMLLPHLTWAQTGEELKLGDVFTIKSAETEETITYYVSLPKGYVASKADYPTIFVLDGDLNLSHTVGSHDVLVRTGYMPPAIIVGIVSDDRTYHFAPTKSEQYPGAGGAEKFIRFIKSELIPTLKQRYRMNGHQTIIGHSFGGLFATYSLINHSGLFDSYIIVAPALWWDDEMMLKRVRHVKPSKFANKRIFFGIGEDDGYGMKQEMKRFIEALPEESAINIWQREFDNEGHMSAPLLTTYFGFKHLFSDMLLSKDIKENFTSDAFLDHEAWIANTYGAEAKQSAESYVFLALELMEKERYQEAAVVFERNAHFYSDFANSWYWLGQAYEKGGRPTDALASYKKAIHLAESGRGTIATYQESAHRVSEMLEKQGNTGK